MAQFTLDPETGKKTLVDAGTANPAGIRPGVSGEPPEKKPAPAAKAKPAAAPKATANQGKI